MAWKQVNYIKCDCVQQKPEYVYSIVKEMIIMSVSITSLKAIVLENYKSLTD